jgi:hypothetical protein
LNLLRSLKQRKDKILEMEESTWRLRSRAIWIEKGDKNTKFFHKFASQRRCQNTIWDIADEEGNYKSTEKYIKEIAYKHFKSQFSAIEAEDTCNQIKVLKDVPRFFNDAESDEIGKPVTLEEVEEIVSRMPKDKIPGPDGWTQELFQNFFDIMGEDLLRAVEESRCSGHILGALNATFFTLIPKVRKPESFHDFRPISLCNFVYKVISKVISSRLKDKLASCISSEQFGFLKDRLIFDVVGIAQECLHTAKSKKLSSIILKLDLKKAYDKVSWQFLRLLLIQIGLKWEVAQWIMACVTNVNMAVLINGSPTNYLRAIEVYGRGSLSPHCCSFWLSSVLAD